LVPAWYVNGVLVQAAYYTWVAYIYGVRFGDQGFNGYAPNIYACTTTTQYVCTPAVAAVPSIPGIPATPSQVIVSLNVGWNSHSRSITTLDEGSYLAFTLDPANTGTFVGVDVAGKDPQQPALFPHGLMIDPSGVYVYESGNVVTQLAGGYTSLTEFHIERRPDGTVQYTVDTARYTSTVPASSTDDLYVYTLLYSGNDRLICASFQTIGVDTLLESITFSGAGALNLASPLVDNTAFSALTLIGSSALLADGVVTTSGGVIIGVSAAGWMGTGTGSLTMTFSTIDGLAYFPALTAFGAEMSDLTYGSSYFPAMTVSGDMYGAYVPATATTAYGVLPQLVSSGIVISVDYCQGDADFPALQAIGGDYAYGIGSAYLPAMLSWGDEGQVGTMWMMSHSVMGDAQTQLPELVLVINSYGILHSVYSDSVIKVQAYISALLAESQFSLIGTYGMSQLSALTVMSLQNQVVSGQADLDTIGRVWVVNMESSASTQYSNYGFNSFFVRDGESYGVADDGIYRLSGNTDLLEPIDAQINVGSMRLGTTKDKLLPAVYINAASDGKLILKVEVDGADPYYYEARSSSEELDNHRVDTGRGLKGNNWTFTLMNQDGDNFELANLEFVPLQGSRRI
jgi:hypothetical protein